MSEFILRQSTAEIQTAITNALNSDPSLSIAGKFADAKATGDAIAACEKPTDEQVNVFVRMWLDEHPEATTTVVDGAVTTEKLADGAVTADKLSDDIVLSGNTEALRIIFNILQNGVFTENVNTLMFRLLEAIESGDDSGGTEPDDAPVVGTRFYVNQNLTNVTSSNSKISVTEGTSYTTTLTPVDGFNMSTVSVKMGGRDVTSSAYSNGVISIVSVTGDIVITAVATKAPELVTEVLEPIWIDTAYPDITTFAYNELDKSGGSSASVYAAAVSFAPSTLGGGVLHVDLDTTILSGFKARIYLFDADGNPYKHTAATNGNKPISGDVTSILNMVDAGTTGTYVEFNGAFTYQIPDGCNVMICTASLANYRVDTTAYPKVYPIVDKITFDGEVLTAKVVKEV